MSVALFFTIPIVSLGLIAAQEYPGSAHGDSSLHGKVVVAGTQEPVRLAAIKIFTKSDQRYELTDGEGRFRFGGVAPGDYSLLAHRDGYTDRSYSVTASDVAAGTELAIELERQGVITGRVLDGMGRPLQSARIEALSVRAVRGRGDVVASTQSDDLGRYRLAGLDPGNYQIRATYQEGREDELDPTPVAIATSYFGGSEGAAAMIVKKGAVTEGIDFALNPVAPVTVRGELQTETGAYTGRASLWIMDQNGQGGSNGGPATDGSFEIPNVAPGTQTISAQTFKADPALYGMTVVEVRNADVAGVKIVLRPVPMLEGEIRFTGGAGADLSQSAIYFTRSDLIAINNNIAHPAADNKFTIALIPGEYGLAFDSAITKLGIESLTLDGKPVVNWKIRIDEAASPHRLVIAMEGKKP